MFICLNICGWFVDVCISPLAVNGDTCIKRETGKRPIEASSDGTDPTLSRKKLKKLRRYPAKSFVPKPDMFAKCGTCGNPKVCFMEIRLIV